ncbi:hypothetical protein [Fimbriiglobus ruber]|uniref:SHOCT domain-containing protein n=1 Tax=Fimbriiglobus ruber TaxID=1908690 RepID=A0A225DY56_9BACT|nr:hypothetical protein [Fimbriiglobus ruber]OWK43468.1 hypothetical protein FRUB_03067 [Fimbriiglobus ruber]
MSGGLLASGAVAVLGAANPFLSIEFLVTVGLLVLALLGGAVVLYITDNWRKRQLAGDNESVESLSSFRTMYDRGELSESEYQVIRDRLAARMKQQDRGTGKPTAANGDPTDGAKSPAPAGGENSAGGAAGPPAASPPGSEVS